MHDYDDATKDICHKNVPLKVSMCAWSLLRNRWPTKNNLVKRDIISNDSQLCVSGSGHNESTYHLLFHCPIFNTL